MVLPSGRHAQISLSALLVRAQLGGRAGWACGDQLGLLRVVWVRARRAGEIGGVFLAVIVMPAALGLFVPAASG